MMRTVTLCAVALLLLASLAACKGERRKDRSPADAAPAAASATPLLDRQLFFGNPEISSGKLSPDGQWVAFMREFQGIMNIWVKPAAAPFSEARPLTDSPRPLYGYAWNEDGRTIIYIKDKDGDENMNLFAVDPQAQAPEGQQVPPSRNLTPLPSVRVQIYHVSDKNPDRIMIGLNDRDPAWHDLYALTLSTGERELLYKNEDRATSYIFDWDDTLRLLTRTDTRGTTVLLRVEPDGKPPTPLYETDVSEMMRPLGWTADNARCYLATNKGELNYMTLHTLDVASGELTFEERDPEGRVDFGNLNIDRATRAVISTTYVDDRPRHVWRDAGREALYTFLRERFPGREIDFQSGTRDSSRFLISVWGDRYASEAYLVDAATREVTFQYTTRSALKAVEAHLAPMEPLSYASSDGLMIPAYLTLPMGVEPRGLPTVVLVHGGPKGPRDFWGYDAEAQFLANRGYAVLQPNFRASGGFGKAFRNAGDMQWGLLMQDDITWGVKHLIAQGVADPARVAIMGGSYGGYATLAGLAFTPELYAAGVDIVGPSNLFTLLASVPPYWEAGRAFLYGMVGDPSTPEGEARMREASPLFSSDRIERPLLIIQGANDPRVKQAESDQIAAALHAKGKQVSYLLADDEGHGFAKPVNRMAMYAEIERFLSEILGGRHQEELPEDVAARLKALRVDVSKLAPPAALENAPAVAPTQP